MNPLRMALLTILIWSFCSLWVSGLAYGHEGHEGREGREEEASQQSQIPSSDLVEYFTADTLSEGSIKLGLDFDYAPRENVMVGMDLLALALGAPSLQMKVRVLENTNHRLALGLVANYYNKQSALWGAYSAKFHELQSQNMRPTISWTNKLSDRLNLHTYWSFGLGESHIRLNESGMRSLWETKNPGASWEARNHTSGSSGSPGSDGRDSNDTNNGNKGYELPTAAITNKILQLHNLIHLQKEIFQITGEYKRDGGKRVLISTRVQNGSVEDLNANTISVTLAQQWILDRFQFRVGLGFKYQVLSGYDLDGQKIEDSGVLPATDIDFYWKL